MNLGLTHHGHRSPYTYPFENVTGTIGNTAAFVLISKSLFKDVGMFNEKYMECLEDVELNLACVLKGRINCLAGNAVGYHYESITRKTDGQLNPQDWQLLVGYIRNNPKINNLIQILN